MKDEPNTCGSCHWAHWPLNKAGRKIRTGSAKCVVPFEQPKVPESYFDYCGNPPVLHPRHVGREMGKQCTFWKGETT